MFNCPQSTSKNVLRVIDVLLAAFDTCVEHGLTFVGRSRLHGEVVHLLRIALRTATLHRRTLVILQLSQLPQRLLLFRIVELDAERTGQSVERFQRQSGRAVLADQNGLVVELALDRYQRAALGAELFAQQLGRVGDRLDSVGHLWQFGGLETRCDGRLARSLADGRR